MADVCTRLLSMAQKNFRLRKPIVEIPQDLERVDVCHPKYRYNNDDDDDREELERNVSRLLQNFGPWIGALEFAKIVAPTIQCCVRKTLTSMRPIRNFPNSLEPIANNLKRLNVTAHCGFRPSFWKWLTDIEDLALSHANQEICHSLSELSYLNLQRIHFRYDVFDSRDSEFFFNKNNALKNIRIDFPLSLKNNHKIDLPAKTEKLQLRMNESTFSGCIKTSSFGKLENFKSLVLVCNDSDDWTGIIPQQ